MKLLQGLLLALCLVSCGHTDAHLARVDALRATVKVAVAEGPVQVRYNPPDCTCPALEMLAEDKWVRIEVVESSDPEQPIEAFRTSARTDLKAGLVKTYKLHLVLESSRPRHCQNGSPYFEVSLVPPPEVD